MPSSYAFVLRRQPYKENALLVDVFTQTHGRLTLVAPYSQRQANRQRAVLEPFRLLGCGWRGSGEVFKLVQLEEKRRFCLVKAALFQATYASEVILRTLLPSQEQAELFRRYQHLLHHLQDGENAPLLLWFELAVLSFCGYPLVSTAQQLSDGGCSEYYRFSAEQGLQPMVKTHVLQFGEWVISAQLVSGLQQPESMDAPQWQELRQVVDRLFQVVLEGKPLYARALLGAM